MHFFSFGLIFFIRLGFVSAIDGGTNQHCPQKIQIILTAYWEENGAIDCWAKEFLFFYEGAFCAMFWLSLIIGCSIHFPLPPRHWKERAQALNKDGRWWHSQWFAFLRIVFCVLQRREPLTRNEGNGEWLRQWKVKSNRSKWIQFTINVFFFSLFILIFF